VRVVAGELGGRRLEAPAGAATRPTAERVRAALFDRLGPAVIGARVLDLYAGSGALGIEALSRGAARATFVEQAARAVQVLRRNLGELRLADRSRVMPSPVRRAIAALAAAGERFDLVLVDAPYAEAPVAWQGALALVARAGVLVAERDGRDAPAALVGARLERRAVYGTTALEFWRRDAAQAADEED
jgi:16S rRNA (guanine966-N2)-methyltransferase